MENGPLWTACRTNGYAYGVAFDFDFNMNLILLSISRCSQLNAAYSKAMETLKNFVEHKINFDSKRIDAARNLTLCLLVEYLATLGRIKNVCIRSYLNKYSIEKYQNLINEVNLFTYNDEILLRIIEKYLSPLINHNQSSTLILVNSNKMKEIKEFLEQEYSIKNVTLIKNIEKYFSQ